MTQVGSRCCSLRQVGQPVPDFDHRAAPLEAQTQMRALPSAARPVPPALRQIAPGCGQNPALRASRGTGGRGFADRLARLDRDHPRPSGHQHVLIRVHPREVLFHCAPAERISGAGRFSATCPPDNPVPPRRTGSHQPAPHCMADQGVATFFDSAPASVALRIFPA